jgi:hypothetical protein
VTQNPNWQLYLSLNPRKYGGKYVAIAGGRRVGAGRKLPPLVRKARKLYPGAIPLIGRIRDPRKVCVWRAR